MALKVKGASVAKRFMRRYKKTAVARAKKLTNTRLYGTSLNPGPPGTRRGNKAEALLRAVSTTGKLKVKKNPRKPAARKSGWGGYQSRLHASRPGYAD